MRAQEIINEESVADQIRADIRSLGGNIDDYYIRFTNQDKLGYSARQTFGRTPDVDNPKFDLEYIGAGQGRPALWFYPARYYLKNKDLYASGQPYAWLVRLKPGAWLQDVNSKTQGVETAPPGKERVGILRQSSVPAAIFFRPGFEVVGKYYDYAGQHQRHGQVKGAPKKPRLWDRIKKSLSESKQATAQQVLDYINKTHYEPLTPKLADAVLSHPRWELVQVPLLNLNIPDQEYDDVDYDEYEPESDPYGRVMTVEPEHAGEISQHLIDKKPIVIDADRYIIDGNHRAWAAKYLLNRDYIMAWRPVLQKSLNELGGQGELKVHKRIQKYFFDRGYSYAGEGRDQMAFESPRGTVVKVLGIGNPEREKIVKDYVEFFEKNQNDPHIPRIYNTGNFTIGGKTYFVYEMEYLNYVANEEETLDYLEKLMSSVARGQHKEFMSKNPVPRELDQDDIPGLIRATLKLEQALGGQAPLDLSMIENLRRRNNGEIVIMDPYSL